jgi:hypothetical protein
VHTVVAICCSVAVSAGFCIEAPEALAAISSMDLGNPTTTSGIYHYEKDNSQFAKAPSGKNGMSFSAKVTIYTGTNRITVLN